MSRATVSAHHVCLPGQADSRLPCSAALCGTRRDQADPGGAEFKSPLAPTGPGQALCTKSATELGVRSSVAGKGISSQTILPVPSWMIPHC